MGNSESAPNSYWPGRYHIPTKQYIYPNPIECRDRHTENTCNKCGKELYDYKMCKRCKAGFYWKNCDCQGDTAWNPETLSRQVYKCKQN